MATSNGQMKFDPLGEQLEIIQSCGIEPIFAKIISSYIGYIESTLDYKPYQGIITSPPTARYNEISLIITPPHQSICHYILKSVTIHLGYFPSRNREQWPKDGEFQVRLQLIDQQTQKTVGKILFEKLQCKAGGKDNELFKCDMNVLLKCGESYLFYLEQTEEQEESQGLHAWLVEDDKQIDHNKRLVRQARADMDINGHYVVKDRPTGLTKMAEIVFLHK